MLFIGGRLSGVYSTLGVIFWGFIPCGVCSRHPTSALQMCSLSCRAAAAGRSKASLTMFGPVGDMSLPAAISPTLSSSPSLRMSASAVPIICAFLKGRERAAITAQENPLREDALGGLGAGHVTAGLREVLSKTLKRFSR